MGGEGSVVKDVFFFSPRADGFKPGLYSCYSPEQTKS